MSHLVYVICVAISLLLPVLVGLAAFLVGRENKL